jgi:hypothetical protein
MVTIMAILTTTMITTTIMIIITITLTPIIMTRQVTQRHAPPGRVTLSSFAPPAGCPAT